MVSRNNLRPEKDVSRASGDLEAEVLYLQIVAKNAQDWSRTSTSLRTLAPQASASAYSATRALHLLFSIYYLLFAIVPAFAGMAILLMIDY